MAEDHNRRPLKEFAQPSDEEPSSSIENPAIPTNNFKLKPSLLQLVQQNQYTGLTKENPNQHLKVFIQLADTFKTNGASPEAIRLRLFPFSLRDRAQSWLDDPKPLECNSIAENKLAKKEKDPGKFSKRSILWNHVIDKAFLDLGASVSLMPLAVCRRLNLGELQPTKMSLQLADRCVKYPVRILEDIPVRIRQLYIPTDFVVMDIKKDDEIPILLGRPFLSTAGAIIDVKRGKLTFEVGDEKI
ncbi:uncharacterized protein LOC127100667 [Lathyrus oleraceus]|uniref:uncharacterized protein LOC127100667 n=1 Tax=Pisum sativum TaxID=3888 RepID=UPI0021CF5B64|nr:uncharacterized protein LOC127100667 [Pisum sativum]